MERHKPRKLEKKGRLIVFLIILLLIAVGYISYDKYTGFQQEKRFSVYQQGAQLGYEQAIIQIAQQAATCQQVPLRIQNQTLNIIAVDCLQG